MYCNNCGQQCVREDGTLIDHMFYSLAGKYEYRISGLCEYCFDDLTAITGEEADYDLPKDEEPF